MLIWYSSRQNSIDRPKDLPFPTINLGRSKVGPIGFRVCGGGLRGGGVWDYFNVQTILINVKLRLPLIAELAKVRFRPGSR